MQESYIYYLENFKTKEEAAYFIKRNNIAKDEVTGSILVFYMKKWLVTSDDNFYQIIRLFLELGIKQTDFILDNFLRNYTSEIAKSKQKKYFELIRILIQSGADLYPAKFNIMDDLIKVGMADPNRQNLIQILAHFNFFPMDWDRLKKIEKFYTPEKFKVLEFCFRTMNNEIDFYKKSRLILNGHISISGINESIEIV